MIDGLLVLGAGALMLTPGFVTDAVGLALLFPPTRALVRAVATRRLARSVASGGTVFTYGWRGDTMSGSGVLDADSWEDGPPGSPDEPRQLDD
jgi:UPF0716 protein FxsA